ncbi:aldehyde reductase [Raoultella planticola]|nr:aldehyde reductase [Raoultella planticola]
MLDQVLNALNGFDVLEFGGIEPNPSYETLMNAVKIAREQNVTFLLAVGGGSVLDGTKFIAAAAHYDENVDPWEILETYGSHVKSAIPMGSVLTLPATGSESNKGAVVSRKTTGDKRAFMSSHVQPVFAILDPVYTYTLPPRQVANGVVDAFVHTVEQYVTYPVDGKIQDRFAEGILLTLIEEGPKALKEPENYDVRANIMWAATQALNGLIGAGVPQDWATHMLGHELTAMHGLDHAQTWPLCCQYCGMKNARLNARNCCSMPLASGILPRALKTNVSMPLSPRRVTSSNSLAYRPVFPTTVWTVAPSRHYWLNWKNTA